jgi:hypothetical protein
MDLRQFGNYNQFEILQQHAERKVTRLKTFIFFPYCYWKKISSRKHVVLISYKHCGICYFLELLLKIILEKLKSRPTKYGATCFKALFKFKSYTVKHEKFSNNIFLTPPATLKYHFYQICYQARKIVHKYDKIVWENYKKSSAAWLNRFKTKNYLAWNFYN